MTAATSKSQLFHYFPNGRLDLLVAVAQNEAEQVLEAQRPHLDDLTTWDSWRLWRQTVLEAAAACARSILAAIQGGVVLLQATDSADFLDAALTSAIAPMRPPG